MLQIDTIFEEQRRAFYILIKQF